MLFIVVTFAVCLFQGIHASTIDEVIAEMQPKIDAAADNIGGSYSRASSNIDNTHVAIDDLVRSGTTRIYNKLETLDQTVIEAIEEQGDTIEQCVTDEEASRNTISLLPLQLCRNSDKWEYMGQQLSTLSLLQLLVISSPSNCIATGVNPDNVRTCIVNVIEDAVQQADLTYKSLSSTVSEVRTATLNCISENTVSIEVQVDTITRNFKTCIANV